MFQEGALSQLFDVFFCENRRLLFIDHMEGKRLNVGAVFGIALVRGEEVSHPGK